MELAAGGRCGWKDLPVEIRDFILHYVSWDPSISWCVDGRGALFVGSGKRENPSGRGQRGQGHLGWELAAVGH